MNTSTVELMAASSRFFTLSGKPVFKNPLRIDENMTFKVSVDDFGRFNMLNLLVSLFVISALPPDGGAAQAMIVESTTSFHTQSALS